MPPTQTDEGIQAAHEIRRRHPAMGSCSSPARGGRRRDAAAGRDAAAPRLPAQGPRDRPRGLRSSLRRVADGGTALDPQVVSGLLADPREADRLGSLSPRERSVLELVAEGRSNKAIGERLAITHGAVQKHVSTIFNKLGLAGGRERRPPDPRRPSRTCSPRRTHTRATRCRGLAGLRRVGSRATRASPVPGRVWRAPRAPRCPARTGT
jgi:DNA-binding CsgD family transcriptional regulator